MSAERPEAWRITLPCSKAQAEAVADAELDGAVLVATEEDEAAGRWRLDAYVEGEPSAEAVAAVRALAPGGEPRIERLDDQDWVAMSQAGLEPVREGRFVVHTSAFPAEPPPGGRAFLIEAAQAFGTGHHETTAGCLAMLDRLAGMSHVDNVIDLGTGTGLLAFAARELWRETNVLATDIDPIAVAVSAENAERNAIEPIDFLVADGTRDPVIAARAPYDLVIANILAGPLVAMAPEIAAIAAPHGAIVLAGLLSTQADAVLAAFHAQGCTEDARDVRGDWTILLLRAGAGGSGGDAAAGDREGWAADR